jgi:glycosyltransferase involved in cell wall biosynthesis
VPARLTFYLGLRRFRKTIRSLGCRYLLTQSPEGLLAVCRWGFDSSCYLFPGAENPLAISRYPLARRFRSLFDRWFFAALDGVDVVMASADDAAIERLVRRSGGRIKRDRLIQMPTCVDTSEFRPRAMSTARESLQIPPGARVFVTTGRVAQFKGWDFLLDSFAIFRKRCPDSLLIFVGDGEDRPLVEAALVTRSLASHVQITGFQQPDCIAQYLNAADVFLCGSVVEGWSVSMLEALACGKPIVSTVVSGAREMVVPDQNGFLVETRDPAQFADAMRRALNLADAERVSTGIAARYSLTRFGQQLGDLWPPLHREHTVSALKQDASPASVCAENAILQLH